MLTHTFTERTCPRCGSSGIVPETRIKRSDPPGVCILCGHRPGTRLAKCPRCGGQVLRFWDGLSCLQCGHEIDEAPAATGPGGRGTARRFRRMT